MLSLTNNTAMNEKVDKIKELRKFLRYSIELSNLSSSSYFFNPKLAEISLDCNHLPWVSGNL